MRDKTMAIKPDYFTMLWELSFITTYTDDYLLSLSEGQVEKLWELKVENNER
jgi:hypothetical protein